MYISLLLCDMYVRSVSGCFGGLCIFCVCISILCTCTHVNIFPVSICVFWVFWVFCAQFYPVYSRVYHEYVRMHSVAAHALCVRVCVCVRERVCVYVCVCVCVYYVHATGVCT